MKKEETESGLKNQMEVDETQTQNPLSHILSTEERAEIITAILSEVFHQFVLIVEKYIF